MGAFVFSGNYVQGGKNMEKLHILWTNADEEVFDKMVFMYARNSKRKGWWNDIELIIWGPTAKLATESESVARGIQELLEAGVVISACKSCSDALKTTPRLTEMGVDVKYVGKNLTEILKSGGKLLSV